MVLGVKGMYLTKEEERILGGEEGWAKAKALEVIVRVGESLGAERLVNIEHAHISGVSYRNIGRHGEELIKSFADSGVRFSVKATVNPIGFDLEDPSSIPYATIDESYVRHQYNILTSLKAMGADLTLSCTPYYFPQVTSIKEGASVAWGESNAVLYANTVLGLKTNREGGPMSLMAAITGKTYYYGLHLEENRVPIIEYVLDNKSNMDEVDYGVLGEIIASMHEGVNPPYLDISLDEISLREFLAALGAAGNIAMIYINGITRGRVKKGELKKEMIYRKEIESRREELSIKERPDLIYFGCPHAGVDDLRIIASQLKATKRKFDGKIVVTTSRDAIARLDKETVGILRSHGVRLIGDTCLVVSPFGYKGLRVATNSYKSFYYLSKRGIKVSLLSIRELKDVIEGW